MGPSDEYKLAKLRALESAIEGRNGALVDLILQGVRADGFGDWAREVMASLLHSAVAR